MTGFVGEQAAGNTVTSCHHDALTDQAASDCAGLECQGADGLDRGDQSIMVHAQNDNAAQHIEGSHEGNQLFTNGSDGLDAADE